MSQDDGPALSIVEGFAYYVYGITLATPLRAWKGWAAMEGMESPEPVYAIPLKELQAVVSRVSRESFGPTTLAAKIQDTAWLQEKVLAHERVIRAVFTAHTIIPMKFGTLFETEGKVRTMLAEHYAEFLVLLAKLDSKEEWGVKIYVDRRLLREELQETDVAIKARRAEIAHKTPGAAYLLQQKLSDQIAARVEQALVDYGQVAYAKLLPWAVEGRWLRLLTPEMTGRPGEMILHAAFLVERERVPLLLAEAESLDTGHFWWQVECAGPWAPYNFLVAREEMQSV